MIISRGVFITIVSIGVVAILSLSALSLSMVQVLSDYVQRENCIATLRSDRDKAAFVYAQANNHRERVRDLIFIPAVAGSRTPAQLAVVLKHASDKVERKEKSLDAANERFAQFNARCPDATPHVVPNV